MSEEISYQSYWAHIRQCAEEAAKADEPHDYAHECADSSWWVIYTHAAHAALMHSDNEDALFDVDTEILASCKCFADVITKLAYFAVLQDILDNIPEHEDEDEDEDEDEA